MWNFCDDGGNHPASLKSLKMQIFPSDDIQVSEIDAMVKELINNGLIAQYTVNNKDYWHVLGWHHQKIDKPNIKHPSYSTTNSQPFDDHSTTNSQPFDDHSTTNSQPFTPVRESKVMEGKVMDINKKENASDILEKQDESHLYVAPSRRTYAMFAEWQPEPKTWAAYLKMSSHIVKPEQFTKYTLLEFIRSNVGNGEKMESEWQKFYVNAIARGYIKQQSAENQQTTQQPNQSKQRQQSQCDDYIHPPLYAPKPKVENAATPEQVKKIIEEMRLKMMGGE
jgi:hypothetical protein